MIRKNSLTHGERAATATAQAKHLRIGNPDHNRKPGATRNGATHGHGFTKPGRDGGRAKGFDSGSASTPLNPSRAMICSRRASQAPIPADTNEPTTVAAIPVESRVMPRTCRVAERDLSRTHIVPIKRKTRAIGAMGRASKPSITCGNKTAATTAAVNPNTMLDSPGRRSSMRRVRSQKRCLEFMKSPFIDARVGLFYRAIKNCTDPMFFYGRVQP